MIGKMSIEEEKLQALTKIGIRYCKTEIIENATLTFDLPLLVRSVVLPEGRRVFLTVFSPP